MGRRYPCRSSNRFARRVSSTRGGAAAIVVGLACLVGCGSMHPPLGIVAGRVTLDEMPVEGASVMFLPNDGGRPASGLTDAQGNYQLRTYEPNDGALVGKHRVTVIKQQTTGIPTTAGGGAGPAPPGGIKHRWLTPQRYARAETSGLTAEVKSDVNHFEFDLVSKPMLKTSP